MNKNKSFDSQVRRKLGEISTTPSYGAWDIFHKKWKSGKATVNGLDDGNFDTKVKSKLKEINRNHVYSHWEKLKYRLETIEIFKQKIVVNKIKESLAVLFFLFTFYNISTHILPETKHKVNIYADAPESLKGEKYSPLNSVGQNHHATKSELPSNETGQKTVTKSGILDIATTLPANYYSTDNVSVSGENIYSETNLSQVSELNISNLDFYSSLSRTNKTCESLPSREIKGFSVLANIIPLKCAIRKITKSENRVGLYVSHVNNFILTPYDKVFALPKFSNATNSQEYGVTFGKKIKNLEMESGIGYSKLRYSPSQIFETFGATDNEYLKKSLQGIEFDFIKIPLNVKYFVVDKPKWKLYAATGVSLQILAQAEYTISENINKGQALIQNRYSDGSKLDEKPFTSGFLDEGKLSGNYFVDVHLGFGVERRIADRLSLYVQPSYQTFVGSDDVGIGPNNDKLNAFHIQTGMKFTLN